MTTKRYEDLKTCTTANDTRAHVLVVFSTFVLKLSPATQSRCVTLTGSKPQCLLGNDPCSTNARLMSCSFPLPFTDQSESSCRCKPRPHSPHPNTCKLQPQNMVANLTGLLPSTYCGEIMFLQMGRDGQSGRKIGSWR